MTNKKILTLISLLLFLFLLVGCMLPPINLPPGITSDPVETATVGVEYVYDVDATDPNEGDVLTYSLTKKPDGMLIDKDSGVITWIPTAAGDFDVTVQVSDEKGEIDAQLFTITVSVAPPAQLTSIVVLPETMSFFVGGEPKAIESVTAHYSDGSEAVLALAACGYKSSDDKVATVDAGEISAVAEGSATITVSYTEEKTTKTVYIEETDTVGVTVSEVELDRIVVLPEAMTLYYEGGEERESASETIESITAHNNDGTKFEVDFVADCTFGLNPVGIVDVIDDEVTATKVGETTLTVTYEGKTDAIEVTVLAFELASIVVVPDTMIFGVDWIEDNTDTGIITIDSVTAHYNDGSEDDTIDFVDCTFVSDDETIAKVAAGVITAVAKGSATITVSYPGVGVDVTAEAFIEVTVSNRAPILDLDTIEPKTHPLGETPFIYPVIATDPDDDILTYFLDTCPSGMNIGPTTGVITWYPTDTGEVVTVVTVKDDDEFDPLSATEEFTITVQ